MLTTYDLYDLSAIYNAMRLAPEHPQNIDVMEAVLRVLQNRHQQQEDNAFRRALQSLPALSEPLQFAHTLNVYVHTPYVCKQEEIYRLLEAINQYFIQALQIGELRMVEVLADCLRNLPIDIAKSHGVVPKTFWRNEVKFFRNEWDKTFLKEPDGRQ